MALLVMLAITGVANVWGVASINAHMLPKATQTAGTALQREVTFSFQRTLPHPESNAFPPRTFHNQHAPQLQWVPALAG